MSNFDDLDNIMESLVGLKLVFDRELFVSWLFEYACMTCEWEGINPVLCNNYVNRVMRQKVNQLYNVCYLNYLLVDRNVKLELPDVEAVVRAEHGGGVPVNNF